ncbi:MAG: arginine--tRNA ligase [Chlamydiales bacterium]|nr:arginine--tRNA ligase [Chlamydiia bacterium]MCP5507751.1 arginine--tRNA ligase [Chlamydiales bacterium]
MKTLQNQLKNLFTEASLKAFPELEGSDFPVEVLQSTQQKFGDYQYNSAMKMAKQLGKPPREIGQRIIDHIDCGTLIESLELAGPGFVNIHLKAEALDNFTNAIAGDAHLAVDKPHGDHRILVEFSSPNTAKELHVGHLRSTIIGDCLARLFEFLGYDVLRLNHIGDWGTQFGMLIAHMKEEAPYVLTGEQHTDLSHLVGWYKESKKRFDDDIDFKKRAQNEVVALQSGNETSLAAWKILCAISREAYQEIYDLLDIKITERGESFYNPMLEAVVDDLDAKGLITISHGAKCIFLEGFKNRDGDPLPLMVQKSDGGYNYDTTDMAAMKQRAEEEGVERIIIVTDAGQAIHFQMIEQASVKAGYLDPQKVQFDHVTFGVVLGPDGKKFKTRSGETERLIDLISTAIEKAGEILKERSPEMDEQERKELARALGIGAIKYADLSCNRSGDYTFSYDRMLRFEGNTAAYLMYSYVRVAGIKRKIGIDQIKGSIILEHPTERALGLHLAQFGEALEQVSKDLLPNRLTDYLYALAEKFNAFYRDCPVEGSEQQSSRLLLCETVARVMKQGLEILGVKTVERM